MWPISEAALALKLKPVVGSICPFLPTTGNTLIKPDLSKNILKLKAQYRNIFLLVIDDDFQAIVRLMTKGEWETYQFVRQVSPGSDRADLIGHLILWPNNIIEDDVMPLGYIDSILVAIEQLSTFDYDELVKRYRQFGLQLEGPQAMLDSQIKMFLPAAFKKFSAQDIQDLDIIDLAEALAVSEKFLKTDYELKTSAELAKQKRAGADIAGRVNTAAEIAELHRVDNAPPLAPRHSGSRLQ